MSKDMVDTETSPLGQILQNMLSGIDHIRSVNEMDKVLVSELKRTVSDHDKAIMLMAKAVEDMNRHSSEMTAVFKEFQKDTMQFQKEIQKEQLKHWQAQDKTMSKVESILENIARQEPRLQTLEKAQMTGCPSFLGFVRQRDAELKHWEDVKQTLLPAAQKNREEIAELRAMMGVLVEQNKNENLNISKLQKAQETADETFVSWKDNMHRALIGYAVVIVGGFASALWGLVTK